MRELFGFLGQVERKVLMVNWAGDPPSGLGVFPVLSFFYSGGTPE
jgi:hypothetical protein